jgi:hypothetical protein
VCSFITNELWEEEYLENVLNKLKEIQEGTVGISVYSTDKSIFLDSMNEEMTIPLASAAKVAIGFCIAGWVEERQVSWENIVEDISFNPAEDSAELYPHFQHRNSLSLGETVEVMIACHDSFIAKRVVQYCGGWEMLNKTIQDNFPTIHVTENPRDSENKGQLDQMLHLIINIFQQYIQNPLTWTPIMNGLVRQKGDVEGIPHFHLNHMTGGLENGVVDLGILGDIGDKPLLFALGAAELPNRNYNKVADEKVMEAMKLLYNAYKGMRS